MTTYLFVTKAEYFPEQIRDGVEDPSWSCAKSTTAGDRALVYVTQQGIRFEWELVSAARPDPDWKSICDCRFVQEFDPPISIGRIREEFTIDEWRAPYANFRGLSAFRISEEIADRIRRLGQSVSTSESDSTVNAPIAERQVVAEEGEAVVGLMEGAARERIVTAYERNPRARQRCLEIFGTACFVCGFRFGSTYGPEYEGFIHVHHLNPMSAIGEAYEIDPARDLRPVCPNCHAVIHRGERALTIEEVQVLLKDSSRAAQS